MPDRKTSISYQDICDRLGFKQTLPVCKDWSATPEFLSIISEHCLSASPETIVECSSGITTLVLSRCCQMSARNAHVYSLENGRQYVEQTQKHIRDFTLQDYSSVLHAPLVDTLVERENFQWYETSALKQIVNRIDCLVIDGPPGFIQKQSRYPALPQLFSLLAEKAVIFLDDAARDDEKALVKRWQNDFPALHAEFIDVPRGCVKLTMR